MLGPLGGSIGASVWVVGGCCTRGGFSCGGRLAAFLLQCRAVGLRTRGQHLAPRRLHTILPSEG